MTRPSSRSTQNESVSKRTAVGLGEVVMPSSFDFSPARFGDGDDFLEISRVNTAIIGDFDIWRQPQLRIAASPRNVGVKRLARLALVRVEMEPPFP